MNDFFSELKRRNIFKVGLAYLVLAWFILQVGSIVAPALNLPEWTLSFVIFILVIGLPLILIFAWAFELTPEGLKKTAEVEAAESVTAETGKKLNHAIIAVLCLAIAALLLERFVFSGSSDAPVEPSVALQGGPYESIAVLPFVNMSDDSQQEYFSDGISEELLNLLAKRKGLRVAARTSSFAYKGQNQDIKRIGQDLDVDTVLEGSVRKSGTKIRITAQLIESGSGYHLWSDTYDRELNDVFAIQDEISEAIVGALQIHLSGEEEQVIAKAQVTNLDAYNAFLKGRHGIDKREKTALYEALANFDLAISHDPEYAPAYAAKGETYILLSDEGSSYGDIPVDQAHNLARPAIDRALQLDPSLADAYAARGLLLQNQEDFVGSIVALNKAIELSPNMSRAYLWRGLAHVGLFDRYQAVSDYETSIKLDPLSLPPKSNLVGEYLNLAEVEKAEQLLAELKAQAPDGTRFIASEVFLHWSTGDLAKAYLAVERLKEQGITRIEFPETFTLMRLRNYEAALESAPVPAIKAQINVVMGNYEMAKEILAAIEPGFFTQTDLDFISLNISGFVGDEESYSAAAAKLADIDLSLEGPLFEDEPRDIGVTGLIIALIHIGEEEKAEVLKENLRHYISEYEAKGNHFQLLDERAALAAIDGDPDRAMEILREAEENHLIFWGMQMDPGFRTLRDREDFQAIFKEHAVHINAERAKLGWDPVEDE